MAADVANFPGLIAAGDTRESGLALEPPAGVPRCTPRQRERRRAMAALLGALTRSLDRRLDIGSRYTGRHAVGQRATELGMHLSADEVGLLTVALKARAEAGALSLEEVDTFMRSWYVQQRTGIVAERG